MPERADRDGKKLQDVLQEGGPFWSLSLLGLVLLGVAGAIYGLLRAPVSGWSPEQARQLVPPLVFGLCSLLVLFNFYAAQKRAIIQALRQGLVQQKIESELNRELSLLDPVTEVYNRRYLRAILNKETNRAKRTNEALCVMMADIVGFRRVNESLGHTGGDVVLKEVAHLIQMRIRNSDAVVRFGSDEFLLVIPGTDEGGVEKLARRLKSAMADWSRQSKMTEFGLSLALGSAPYVPERSVDYMLELAEQRMRQDAHAPKTPAKDEERSAKGAAGSRS
jgi:diguanylate cyclase (GGDEF)-like protein